MLFNSVTFKFTVTELVALSFYLSMTSIFISRKTIFTEFQVYSVIKVT